MSSYIHIPLFSIAVLSSSAQALILYGADNSTNLGNPGTGVPWESVGRLSNSAGTIIGGSGVYLGNGYVLTANHVTPIGAITFDGTTFHTHDGFTPQQIGTTDMKLFRLSSLPPVAPVNLYPGTSEVGNAGTMIGWGRGRNPSTSPGATVVPWGNAATSAKRWGFNTPTDSYDDFRYSIYMFDSLQVTLGSDTGSPAGDGIYEAAATLYDSGSGLFQFLDGSWYLTGLASTVAAQSGSNTSTFGNDVPAVFFPAAPPATATQIGLLPGAGDPNIYVRISSYAGSINQLIPEPSSSLLSLFAFPFLLRRRR